MNGTYSVTYCKNALEINPKATHLTMYSDKGIIKISLNVGIKNVIELKTELPDKFVGATIEFVPEASLESWKEKLKQSMQ